MDRTRRVLRVVVASPGDVARERNAVAKVFDEINGGIARDRGVLCEVWRWETDAWPQFHPQGPQGAIDRVLRIDDCDLLVGVFWKRFGTPTADAASGTEHEICVAHTAWKQKGRPQVMLYFSQRPYVPQTQEELDQWGKVLGFRKEFEKAGLLWPYRGPADFERLLRQHATQFLLSVRDGSRPSAPGVPETGRDEAQVPPSPRTPTFEVTVEEPGHFVRVGAQQEVRGRVRRTDGEPAVGRVVVVVWPETMKVAWVQEPVCVRPDGSWRAEAHFGDPGPQHRGIKYDVAAFFEPPRQLREGDWLDRWPDAVGRSVARRVIRR